MILFKLLSKYFNWDITSFFKSHNFNNQIEYVFVKDVENYSISTYPMFIVNNLSIKKEEIDYSEIMKMPKHERLAVLYTSILKNNQNIFKSSDFNIINTAFGSIKQDFGQTLKIGQSFKFYDKEYKVNNIKITIADFFNDYTFTGFETGKVKEGKPIPYNIIIEIDIED